MTEAPAAKRARDSHVRTFRIKKLGGLTVDVKIAADSDVGMLEVEVARCASLGFCFTLLGSNGEALNDISAHLPNANELECHIEDTSQLDEAAQNILEQSFERGTEDLDKVQRLRLGRCRALDCFQYTPDEDDYSGPPEFTPDGSDDEDSFGVCYVLEFTLIDGEGKRHRLIGVTNDGVHGSSTAQGWTCSVYLRPGYELVAELVPIGALNVKWEIKSSSWYNAPSEKLPPCEDKYLLGGRKSTSTESSPLAVHIAHALSVALGEALEEETNASIDCENENGEEETHAMDCESEREEHARDNESTDG